MVREVRRHRIDYLDLLDMIKKYYHETYGTIIVFDVENDVDSMYPLYKSVSRIARNDEDLSKKPEKERVLMPVTDGIGDGSFPFTKSDMEKIIISYFACLGERVSASDISFDFEDIYVSGTVDPLLDSAKIISENTVSKPDIYAYVSKISYNELNSIIVDYYKQKGMEIKPHNIDDLKKYLAGKIEELIYEDSTGNIININKEDINTIIIEYFSSMEFKSVGRPDFRDDISLYYVHQKDNNKITPIDERIDNFKKKIDFLYKEGGIEDLDSIVKEDDGKAFDEDASISALEEEAKSQKNKEEETEPEKEQPVKDMELRYNKRVKNTFDIIQRRRAIDNADEKRTKCLIGAGICLLGAIAAVYFNPTDINKIIEDLSNSIYSWENFVEYLKDLGPLTTFLSAGAASFLVKYFKTKHTIDKLESEEADQIAARFLNQEGGRTL